MRRPARLAMFALAWRLRRPLAEVEEMSLEEFLEWQAFLKWVEKQDGAS